MLNSYKKYLGLSFTHIFLKYLKYSSKEKKSDAHKKFSSIIKEPLYIAT